MEHIIPTEELKKLCDQIKGSYGLYVSIPQENKRFMVNEAAIFNAASTMKIPALAKLMQDAEEGLVDLEEMRQIKPENRVRGSGILKSLSPRLELPVLDIAELMMVLSDNSATNEILDIIGLDRVREFCKENGYENTWVWTKLFFQGEQPEPQNPEGTPQNATCAWDLGRMMESIAKGRCVSENASRQMVQIMAGQQVARLKTLLPNAPHADPRMPLQLPPEGKVTVASKGGTLCPPTGIAHDAGIFYLPDGRYYVMVVCTQSESVRDTTVIIQQAGLIMYEAMKGQ